MASQAARVGAKQVKPLLSLDRDEARKRALNLYKAWYRQLPHLVRKFDIPKSTEQCKQRLRQEYMKNKDITDVRIIDMLIIKGQMELKECVNVWKQKSHIMYYFKDFIDPKPTDFLSKFFRGN